LRNAPGLKSAIAQRRHFAILLRLQTATYKDNSLAFTRLECAAVASALSLLLLATAGMTRTEFAHTAACHNNLRQLGLALLEYSADNAGTFPPRAANPYWPERLRLYYKQVSILTCPSDGPAPRTNGAGSTNAADAAPRSYLLNGWNDYYNGFPPSGSAFPESAILEPARTVIFGEKVTESGHFWMDYWLGDDFTEVEQGRHHRTSAGLVSGASNHAFADGSVRLLKWGAAFSPVNLWAVEPEWRNAGVMLSRDGADR
jgi:hypothetical protein